MSDLRWKNPPIHKHDWGKIAAKLQASPGKWALVAESFTSNTCPPLKRRGIKVQSHRVAYNRYDIYAMHPGADA